MSGNGHWNTDLAREQLEEVRAAYRQAAREWDVRAAGYERVLDDARLQLARLRAERAAAEARSDFWRAAYHRLAGLA